MTTHKLKIEQQYLDDLISGTKTFELRFNDRNYQKGDMIEFWNVGFVELTCIISKFEILSVFSGIPNFGIEQGWVILSIKQIK